jgi:hypothetical protein
MFPPPGLQHFVDGVSSLRATTWGVDAEKLEEQWAAYAQGAPHLAYAQAVEFMRKMIDFCLPKLIQVRTRPHLSSFPSLVFLL